MSVHPPATSTLTGERLLDPTDPHDPHSGNGLRSDDHDDDQFHPFIDAFSLSRRPTLSRFIFLVNFFMALDFMIVFLTVYAYWSELDGNLTYSSIVFSTYSYGQMVAIPIVGWLLDKKIPARFLWQATIALNVVGNILYAVAGSTGSSGRALMAFGRLMTGLGAGNVVIGNQFLVELYPSISERTNALASFNLAGFLGRVLGPTIAIALMYINPWSMGALRMDENTMPAWITALVGIIAWLMCLHLQPKRPVEIQTEREGSGSASGSGRAGLSGSVTETSSRTSMWQDFKGKYGAALIIILLDYMFLITVFWAWYPNISSLAFVQFHFQGYGSTSYLCLFAPVMIGIVVGTKILKGALKRDVPKMHIVYASCAFMVLGLVFSMHFSDESVANDLRGGEWRYWVGAICLPAGFTMTAAMLPAAYSYIVGATRSSHVAQQMGLLSFIVAGSRAIGSTWTQPILNIHKSQCCRFEDPDTADVTCCERGGINVLYAILLGLAGVLFLIHSTLLSKVLNHEDSAESATASRSRAQSRSTREMEQRSGGSDQEIINHAYVKMDHEEEDRTY